MKAIKLGWITHPNCKELSDWEDRKYLNPNAIDFTVDKIFSIAGHNRFVISESDKTMRGGHEIKPVQGRLPSREGVEYWNLVGKGVWDCLSDAYVKIPEGVACELIIRSTFARNGCYLTSGLYDSGFEGHIGFAFHSDCSGGIHLAPGTRIGQIRFVQSDSHGVYAGQYNHAEGTNAHQADE